MDDLEKMRFVISADPDSATSPSPERDLYQQLLERRLDAERALGRVETINGAASETARIYLDRYREVARHWAERFTATNSPWARRSDFMNGAHVTVATDRISSLDRVPMPLKAVRVGYLRVDGRVFLADTVTLHAENGFVALQGRYVETEGWAATDVPCRRCESGHIEVQRAYRPKGSPGLRPHFAVIAHCSRCNWHTTSLYPAQRTQALDNAWLARDLIARGNLADWNKRDLPHAGKFLTEYLLGYRVQEYRAQGGGMISMEIVEPLPAEEPLPAPIVPLDTFVNYRPFTEQILRGRKPFPGQVHQYPPLSISALPTSVNPPQLPPPTPAHSHAHEWAPVAGGMEHTCAESATYRQMLVRAMRLMRRIVRGYDGWKPADVDKLEADVAALGIDLDATPPKEDEGT